MSFNTAMLEAMQAEGLDLDACIRVLKAGEKRNDPTAAERMARMRAKRKAPVTRNVTHEPPNDIYSNPPPSAKAKGESARGTRLPDDFSVPDDWLTWAMAKRRWTRADAVEESEQFCRYWQAKAGAGAAKRDWLKTWQQWTTNSRRQASASASVTPIRDLTVTDHEWAAKYQADRDPVKAAFHEREAARLRKPASIGSLTKSIQIGA